MISDIKKIKASGGDKFGFPRLSLSKPRLHEQVNQQSGIYAGCHLEDRF
jgi:hypothetical protein